MINFLLKRIMQAIIVLFILSIIIFTLLHFMPGDPLEQYIKTFNPSQEQVNQYKKLSGYDKPLYQQYLIKMDRFLHLDFGQSERYQIPVLLLLKERIIITLKLTIPVLLLSILIAIPIGIYIAVYQYSKLDYFVNLLVFIGISAPTFWLGLLGIYFFSLKLPLFPPGGIQTLNIFSVLDEAKYYILPIITLAIHGIGNWVRYIRGTLLEVLNLEYIRTARAKGLSEDTVIFKHALKNALIPVLTLFALSIPYLFGGALVTEQIFSIPGMGHLLLTSVLEKDRDIALAAFMFLSLLTLIFNLIADLAYGFIDPRIKNN